MDKKLKILFVDDEDNILSGLKRTMRHKQGEWEMVFRNSGQAALDALEEEHFDFLVTDMMMPGMNGSQLLNIVKDKHPDVVRVVLSGHAERDLMLKTAMSVHQYLHKPCVPELLIETVSRATKLRECLRKDAIKKVTNRLMSLPSIPELYTEIMDAMNDPDVSIDTIADIIGKDMSMAAKILQVVNSAFFGIPHHVTNLNEAITILGIDIVRSLVLGASIFEKVDKSLHKIIPVENLWNQAFYTSLYAKKIAEYEQVSDKEIDYCFMGGLLHKIGIVVLASNMPEEYKKVAGIVKETGMPLYKAEEEIFMSHHGEIGGYVLSLWGLPDPIVEGVAYHNNPSDCESMQFLPLSAIHVGNRLALDLIEPDWTQAGEIDTAYLKKLGVYDHFEKWNSWGSKENATSTPDAE